MVNLSGWNQRTFWPLYCCFGAAVLMVVVFSICLCQGKDLNQSENLFCFILCKYYK